MQRGDTERPRALDIGAAGEYSGAIAGLRKSQETTRSLLDAAVEVFGESGFEAARIHEVARRCGLTAGAVYARWPRKLDLFRAVVEYVTTQRMAVLLGTSEAPAGASLADMGANLLSQDGRGIRDLTLEAYVAARHDDSLAEAVAGAIEAEAGALTAMVEEGKESGVIDPSLSTGAIVLLCRALGLGTQLATAVESSIRPAPTTDEWKALITRVAAAVAAPSSDG